MENDWDNSLIEVLNSLSKSKPYNIYIFGSTLSDIIYLKFKKKNIKIKDADDLLILMESIIKKASPKLLEVVNSVEEKHIIKEKDFILNAEKYQRWMNFKKMCKICNKSN